MTFKKLPRSWMNRPFFLFLLPVFFVGHGYVAHYNFVSVGGALFLVLLYSILSAFLFGLTYFIFRKVNTAALTTLLMLLFYFFFGNLQDILTENYSDSFLTQYRFLLPAGCCAILLASIYIHRSSSLEKLNGYFNTLFLILPLIDLMSLFFGISKSNEIQSSNASLCDTCKKQDVYLIVLDGYAGKDQLSGQFQFSNTSFLNRLEQMGFRNFESCNSNYNYTPYSIASLLNMDYLDSVQTIDFRKSGNRYALERINDSKVVSLFKAMGYEIQNHSVFRLDGHESITGTAFMPSDTKLITSSTLASRFEKDVMLVLALKYDWDWYLSHSIYRVYKQNKKLLDVTRHLTMGKKVLPQFVYLHLLMPHHPYFFKEDGTMRSFDELKQQSIEDKDAYLSYLKYTNHIVLDLVQFIRGNSPKPPVILLVSDHGYRYQLQHLPKTYHYSSLMSVYLPSGSSSRYRDSLSNVNLFRQFFNNEFGQQFDFLENKTHFIRFYRK